jgi:DNA primase
MLGGYAEEVVLALDADRAGREAMLRAQRVAGSGRLRLLVAAMPEGEDPADMLLTAEGGDRLRAALADAVDLAVFHARAILGDADLATPAGRDRALDEVVPVLVGMRESITRQELVREVTDRLDATPELVAARMRGAPRAPAPVAPEPARPESGSAAPPAPVRRRKATPQEKREYEMLALCMKEPKLGREYLGKLEEEHFTSPRLREGFLWLREHLDDPLDGVTDADANLHNLVTRLQALDLEAPTGVNLAFRFRLLERNRLHHRIKEADASGDVAQVVELQRHLGELNDAIASGSSI